MEEYTHKENSGSLFKNNYKTEDRHPDYKGKINIAGKIMDIALWKRMSKDGKTPFLSVQVAEPYQKEQQPEVTASEYAAQKDGEDIVDFIPF